MRIVMLASGSRGDLQAFTALGLGLQAAGHRVTVATHGSFAAFVRRHGLGYERLSGDSESFFRGIAGVALRDKWRNPLKLVRFCERYLGPFMERFLSEAWQVARNADALVYWPILRAGPSLAEKLGIPCLAASHYPMPYQRTGAFANPFFSPLALRGRLYHRLTYLVGEAMWWRVFRRQLDRWRRATLGLPPLAAEGRAARRLPHLLGFSPAVLPRPADWPPWMHVTGYWLLDREADPPTPELAEFVAAGEPPVSIGFGSMIGRRPEELTAIAVEALRRTGKRGVLLSGWGGLGGARRSASVFEALAVDHDWLFPRAAAVVHHGGSGTTAAAVRAGVPSVVTPFGFDQPLWARRLAELGVGAKPIAARRLDAARLADAIAAVTADPAMRRRAVELGERVRSEDGVGRAVELFHQYAGGAEVVSSSGSAECSVGDMAMDRATGGGR